MLNGSEARAQTGIASGFPSGQIDPALLNALQFEREQSEDPGAVFSPDTGLLVGFGPNLLHCDSASTCQLFTKGRRILISSGTEDVQENVDPLTVGTRGTVTQTVQDSFGRVITATMVVEAINDLPSDFLITGNTNSNLFTGAFVRITTDVHSGREAIAQVKTTYNLLTRTFPLGVNVSISPTKKQDIIDRDVASLIGIALQIVETKFGNLSAVVPTDLQQDFPWKKVIHAAVAVVATVVTIVIATAPVLAIGMPEIAAVVILAIVALVAWNALARDFGLSPIPSPIP
jgi:hypothetical protein